MNKNKTSDNIALAKEVPTLLCEQGLPSPMLNVTCNVMKTALKTLFVILILISCKSNKIESQESESLFLGYEKIGILDESNTGILWLRETLIKFKNDSVFIDQNPISVNKKDTLYSSSDGGFYYFQGIKTENLNKIKILTKEIACDYCPTEMKRNSEGKFEKIDREKNFEAEKIPNGLKAHEIIFKKIKNRKLRSELY